MKLGQALYHPFFHVNPAPENMGRPHRDMWMSTFEVDDSVHAPKLKVDDVRSWAHYASREWLRVTEDDVGISRGQSVPFLDTFRDIVVGPRVVERSLT